MQLPDLRREARLRDIDRRLFSLRLTRLGILGAVVPGLAVVSWMVVPRLFELHAWTTANGLAALAGLVFGGAAFVQGYRRLRDEMVDLEVERRALLPRADGNAGAGRVRARDREVRHEDRR